MEVSGMFGELVDGARRRRSSNDDIPLTNIACQG